MTTTKNNEHKKLNVPNKQEQNQTCLDAAEREGLRPKGNIPNLRFPEFQEEWEKCKLGTLTAKVGSGSTPKGGNAVYTSTGHCFVRSQNVGMGYLILDDVAHINDGIHQKHKATELKEDDVLLNITGASIGRTAIATKEIEGGNVNQHVCIIRANSKVSPKFLCNYIQTKKTQNYIQSLQTGGSREGLNFEQIRSFPISLPNIAEQNKIAQLLDKLNERIATQNKIIDKLQSLIKGINQRVFMNNGINYKLGEICEIRSGYSGNQLLSKKGLKVSRIETISGHKVNIERVGYVAPFESSDNYRLRVGDILFSNINSVEYIGNTAFIDKDYNLYHGMNLLRLTPNNMVVIPFYLYLLLNTNRMLNRFKTVCNKAVSQASINQTELGKAVVQIPDINAQKQICELYQALYDKLESEKYANSLFQKQKLYLLRQIFI